MCQSYASLTCPYRYSSISNSTSVEGEANKADSSDVERPITFSAERPVEDSEAIEEKEPTEHFEQIAIFDDDF